MNAHCEEWDIEHEEDDIGKDIAEQVELNEFRVLNEEEKVRFYLDI